MMMKSDLIGQQQKTKVIKVNWLKRLFSKEFVEWKDYKAKINFISDFNFQQDVREENVRRL